MDYHKTPDLYLLAQQWAQEQRHATLTNKSDFFLGFDNNFVDKTKGKFDSFSVHASERDELQDHFIISAEMIYDHSEAEDVDDRVSSSSWNQTKQVQLPIKDNKRNTSGLSDQGQSTFSTSSAQGCSPNGNHSHQDPYELVDLVLCNTNHSCCNNQLVIEASSNSNTHCQEVERVPSQGLMKTLKTLRLS
jgi:hypothetical protein